MKSLFDLILFIAQDSILILRTSSGINKIISGWGHPISSEKLLRLDAAERVSELQSGSLSPISAPERLPADAKAKGAADAAAPEAPPPLAAPLVEAGVNARARLALGRWWDRCGRRCAARIARVQPRGTWAALARGRDREAARGARRVAACGL